MFLLKSIGSIVWGKKDDALVQVPSGKLYRHNPPGSKIAKTLLFKECTATVKRTNVPRNYQLVVTRVFDEGEDEDDLDADTDYTFLIDEVLFMRKVVTSASKRSLFWVDPLDDSKATTFELVINPKTTDMTVSTFELVFYQCMFERRSGRDHQSASDEEMEAYINFAKATAVSQAVAKKSNEQASEPVSAASTPVKPASSAVPSTPLSVADPMSIANTPGGMATGHIPAGSAPKGDRVVSVIGDLYLYNFHDGQFAMVREAVTTEILRTSPFEFHLVVSGDGGEAYISQPLDSTMNAQFNRESMSFAWVFKQDEGQYFPWSLKFRDHEAEAEFRNAFGSSMYEANNRDVFTTMKAEEQRYVVAAFNEDVEMTDAVEEQEQEEEEEEEEHFEDAQYDAKNVGDSPGKAPGGGSREKISQLAIGHKDRSFYIRGNTIGVLKHLSDDGIEYATTINNVSTVDGKSFFSPRKVMLHEQDTSMLLMKEGAENSIFRMDLNVGKVVEEWKVDDIIPVNDIVPDFKTAQMTPQKTLIGINSNSIFRIDPRLSGKKLVDSESKQYTVKNKFSCAATTGAGGLAVASEKGDIRLYNKLNIRAKSHLPGLGDPIIGIDSTENGKWLIATCRNYLLLTCTEAEDISGYTKSLGDRRPPPRRLQLKPEHVAFMGKDISFTPAKFNTGDDEERTIVTSTGPYVITWNFRRVKQGKLYDYNIKMYDQNVVADNFKYGQDKNIIVALPDEVESLTKNRLQTPAKMLKSRSDIVNSPY